MLLFDCHYCLDQTHTASQFAQIICGMFCSPFFVHVKLSQTGLVGSAILALWTVVCVDSC